MGIFDGFVERNGTIVDNKWIAWIHEGYKEYGVDYTKPAKEYANALKKILDVAVSLFNKCCPICITLNSCHFVNGICQSSHFIRIVISAQLIFQ